MPETLPLTTGNIKPDSDNLAIPSDFCDPALKRQKPYNLQYAKAMYAEYTTDNTLITLNRRTNYISNRLYAESNQPVEKYKKWSTFKDDKTGKNLSYVDLDFSPVSVISKYRDVLLSILEKNDYEFDFDALDPASDEKKLQEKYNVWAKKKVNDILEAQGILQEATGSTDEIMPESREELEIYMSTFKLSTEMALKGAVDLTLVVNKFPEVGKLVRGDLVDNGIGGVREYVDKNGKHKIRYVDPVNLFVRKTRMPDCSGSNAIGEVIQMTVSELVAEAGDRFTIKEYQDIIRSNAGKYNNPTNYYDDYIDTDSDDFRFFGLYGFLGKYGDWKIKVFDVTWLSQDELYYEEKISPSGEKMVYEKPYGYTVNKFNFYTEDEKDQFGKEIGKKYIKKDQNGIQTAMDEKSWNKEKLEAENKGERKVVKSQPVIVYGNKWIIGTEYCYDFGPMNDIARDNTALSEVYLPYHLYRVSNKSVVERMIPFADAYMLAWLKLQNAKAKARPNGLIIEITALENLSINGLDFTPLQALSVYDVTGNLIYKNTDTMGNPNRSAPVQPSIGGLGPMLNECIADMNYNIQQIREVTGLNETIDASTPEKGVSVKASQMAAASSSNAIYPIISAWKNIFERVVKSSALKFQIMSHFTKLQGYEDAIGSAPRKIIEIGEDMSMLQMGIKVTIAPSEEEKNMILQQAMNAMNTKDESGVGQIIYPDFLFVQRVLKGGNLKYAEGVLAYRMEKRAKAKQLAAQQNSKVNGEIQKESLQQAAQIDEQKLEKMHQFKLEEISASADAEIRVIERKLSLTKDIQESTNLHKERVAAADNHTDIVKKGIESGTKLEIHNREKEAEPVAK